MKFTPEELAEMAAADEEIEASFTMTQSEIDFSRQIDKAIRFESLTGDKQKLAAQQKAYREANREKYNAYMREYMMKRRHFLHRNEANA